MRKRDDIESGYLYRVVQRAYGSDDEWEHSNYGHGGKPRTYMTLSAARGMRTQMVRQHRPHTYVYEDENPPVPTLEFAVQRSPVTDWEIV